MKRQKTGSWVVISKTGEKVSAFVPDPLPPAPEVEISLNLRNQLDQALLELGRLDSITRLLPDTSLFLYMYVRKEAVLSSQIEGTQSSLSDLLLFEAEAAPGAPLDDVQEVSNYVAAMTHGLKRLREGLPFCNRLIRELHKVLLSGSRGDGKAPGEFRTSQNWIGGTRPGNALFVPPPPEQVMNCMGALEKFFNDQPSKTPILLKAGLAHVQFETIHPFLDGNGRVGRLLIPLLLCQEGVLREPLLYLSLFLKTHRKEYYRLLQQVRTDGDWESWMEFFVEAVVHTAQQAVVTVDRLHQFAEKDRTRIRKFGRLAGSGLRVHQAILTQPVFSVNAIHEKTGLVPNTIGKVLRTLIQKGIVKELTGHKRNRIFSYDQYMRILSEGTEPLSRH
jgi:Fic family protein